MNIKDTLEASKKNIGKVIRRALEEISESDTDIMEKLDCISEIRELLRGLDVQSYALQHDITAPFQSLLRRAGGI